MSKGWCCSAAVPSARNASSVVAAKVTSAPKLRSMRASLRLFDGRSSTHRISAPSNRARCALARSSAASRSAAGTSTGQSGFFSASSIAAFSAAPPARANLIPKASIPATRPTTAVSGCRSIQRAHPATRTQRTAAMAPMMCAMPSAVMAQTFFSLANYGLYLSLVSAIVTLTRVIAIAGHVIGRPSTSASLFYPKDATRTSDLGALGEGGGREGEREGARRAEG